MDSNVWSGRAVLSHADAIVDVHRAFIQAGAEVIIANTFAAARHMLEPGGWGDHVKEINLNAVSLARQARDQCAQEPVAIAGSICEWAPTENSQWHSAKAVFESSREQAELLAEAGVDLIALEMCQEIELSIAATEAALETGLPVWIGMSAKTHKDCDHLSVFDYPELNFESLVKALSGYPAMLMNIMHTPVTDIDESIKILKQYWHGPIGIYPESGYFTMPDWQFVDIIEADKLAEMAQGWVNEGIRMVGGCCGLGPDHIAALSRIFKHSPDPL
ncbi:MAG: homocysteine S-methyltransferase family protein [Gammaproteobacteria bacterium]|nr:homocysteine S-methyltransferase family protein [Gammaproteobacteria bacterium]